MALKTIYHNAPRDGEHRESGLSPAQMALSAARIRAEAEANPYSQPWDFKPAERLEDQLEEPSCRKNAVRLSPVVSSIPR